MIIPGLSREEWSLSGKEMIGKGLTRVIENKQTALPVIYDQAAYDQGLNYVTGASRKQNRQRTLECGLTASRTEPVCQFYYWFTQLAKQGKQYLGKVRKPAMRKIEDGVMANNC